MSKSRKDANGRALRKGETYRPHDNRYMFRYTDPLGRQKTIYANTLFKLREKENQLMKDRLDGLDVYLSAEVTLNYVFDRYISTKQNIKEQTRASYHYFYDHFVRDTIGKRKISSIRYSDVKMFYQTLLNENGIQLNTLSNVHCVLHPVFTMAVRDGIIRTNPSDHIIREISQESGKNKGIRHALTLEQQRAFLQYTDESPVYHHWLPVFTVMFGTGLRVGELIGLRWEDVDLEKRLIHVNHAIVYRRLTDGKMNLIVSTPKTNAGYRTVPMMEQVYRALIEEKNTQEETGIFNTQIIDGMSGFIFCNKDGNVHKPNVLNAAIRRISEAYNAKEEIQAKREKREAVILPHFSCHHIRHTFCTRFCEQETNIKTIQDIMGHANIETTLDIYAEATLAKKEEAIRNLQDKIDLF